MMTEDLPWRNAHRVRLHQFANNHSLSLMSIMTTDFRHDGRDDEWQSNDTSGALGSRNEEVLTREAMHFFFDMKLAASRYSVRKRKGRATICGE